MTINLSKKRRVILTASALLLVAIGGLFVWLQSGNSATVTSNADTSKTATPPTEKILRDARFMFHYPGDYHLLSDAPQAPDLSNYVLATNTSYDKRLAVTLTESDLSSTSAYLFRKTRSDIYTNQNTTVPAGNASVWSKTDGSEVTAFLEHNGLVVTISLSIQNSNALEGLAGEMTGVLNSFQWQ